MGEAQGLSESNPADAASAPKSWWRRRVWWFVVFGLLVCAALWSNAHLWLPALVDGVRGLPGVGFGRMHHFEQGVFAAFDRLQRTFTAASPHGDIRPPPRALSSLWPPAPLQPILLSPTRAGEGLWEPMAPACDEGAAAPGLMRTTLRVDPERPDAEVILVAADLRRLRLQWVPGRDDEARLELPSAALGVLPEPPSRLVAAFNGGFQSRHGAFGMAAQGAWAHPPLADAATLAQDSSGRLHVGVWSAFASKDGASGEGVEPLYEGLGDAVEWSWVRQNLQPVWDGAAVRDQLYVIADGRREKIGHSVTRRSGVCVRAPSTLIYVWTRRGRAEAIGRAMHAAGCDWGMHLDLNAFHTCFEVLDLSSPRLARDEDGRWRHGCARRLTSAMKDNPEGRYLQAQQRDFFVLVEREAPVAEPLVIE